MAIVQGWERTDGRPHGFVSLDEAERRIADRDGLTVVVAHASETFGRIARRRGRDEARVAEDRAASSLLATSRHLLREHDVVIHEPETDVFAVVLWSETDADPVDFAYIAESIERRLRAALDVDAYGGWSIARPGGLAHAVDEALSRGRLEGDRRRLATGLHDLLTPVAAIASVLSSVADGALDAETQRHFVAAALHESMRVSRMIRQLVSVERATVLHEVTDVRASVAYAIGAMASLAATRGMRVEACDQTSCRVGLDYDAMSAVIVNLLDNAIKYGRPHGRIELRVASVGERCRIDVDDDGPGIPDELRLQIFEPGVRLASSGLGLGLASVRTLVESGCGSIAVERSHLGGARLRVDLPLA